MLPSRKQLTSARLLSADAGAFSLTGADATLRLIGNVVMPADAGSFAASGSDATLLRDAKLSAATGAMAVSAWAVPEYTDPGYASGLDATFAIDRVLSAQAGAFSISGQPATVGVASFVLLTPAQQRRLLEIYMLHGLANPLVVSGTERSTGSLSQSVTTSGGTTTIETLSHATESLLDVGLMIDELAALHGLTTTLTVTSTQRTAGAITQAFTQAGGATTVTRQ